MLDLILSQTANGIVVGFLYVLMALGLTIIFGLLGIVNFAHGAFFALGAYLAVTLQQRFGWWAVPIAPMALGAVSMIVEVVLFRRTYGQDPLINLVVTFALALLIEAGIKLVWGPFGMPFGPPEFLRGITEYGPILITDYRLFVVAVTLAILVALWAFLRFTPYGRILRAGGRDPEMVALLGINLPRVLTAAFGLGIALTGAAGALAAPLWAVKPDIAEAALVPAFVTVIVGGLGSYVGAIVAGLGVGITTALTIQFWPEASVASMYVLMVAVLLWRPRGLFGER
jgi:branched-chain amino acid transport system permease protein